MKTYALKMAPTTSANAPMMLNGPARIRTFPGIASPIGTPVAGSSAYAALRFALNTRAAAIADPAASTVSTMGATSARAPRRETDRERGRDAYDEHDGEGDRVARIPAADRERVEGAKEEARGDEISESGSREQHDRARAEISRHEEGADQVPGPIEHLVPAE